MTAEDDREQRRHEAVQHARLVEGMAMAFRARPDAIFRYAADWRKAEWLQPGTQETVPPEPAFSLLTDPYFAPIAQEAAQSAPTTPPTPTDGAPVPVYRVRKRAHAG